MLLKITYVIAVLIVFLAVYLAIRTNILRSSGKAGAKYSFTNVQMLWWTVIIGSAFIILYGETGDYGSINHSTVILLSISLATTAGSSLINADHEQKGLVRHQDLGSNGFFQDILSDGNGINMHRLQALIFNILFGITFIANFWMKEKFPEFNTAELSLIGVSSGAYLALKTNENKSTPAPKEAVPQST